ncbi:metallophosphoesterase [Candidatus Woesearchaeota archaeon]|nr:metallophosphoesterase [Candidatus Woesearchaeota archaeon]
MPFDAFEALSHKDLDSLCAAVTTGNPIDGFKQELGEIFARNDAQFSRLQANPQQRMRHDQVKVIWSYQEDPRKRGVQDFVTFFSNRFYALEKVLRQRQELAGVLSIGRVVQKKDRDQVAIIGIVVEKSVTKNNNLIIRLEDPSGEVNVLVSNKRSELFMLCRDIVHDEVIGVTGAFSETTGSGGKWVMANNVYFPEIPRNKELKKASEEGYAVFISDIHVGSKEFLEENLRKMLQWTKGGIGTDEQKEIARKIKYIFVAGDLVDGVGIHMAQEEGLTIKDIFKQYECCADLFSAIPSHIPMIVCPGNHDALRITEPQPALYKDFSKAMWELPNIYLVSNPSVINIDATDVFPGFDMLMYHGYSFDYYAANVESIRYNGGYDRADLIMKFLLQRRHLAPAHTSTQYLPDTKKDPLVIEKVPDFFLTGHVHRASVSMYRNVTMVNGSCWQDMTPFQIKTGHQNIQPARAFAMDLQSRAIKILRF